MSPPTSYRYQWARNGSTISGATSPTYVPSAEDAGQDLSCTVTGVNSAGSTSATSAAVGVAPLPTSQRLILGICIGNGSSFDSSTGNTGSAGLTDHGAAQFAAMKAAGINAIRIDTTAPQPVPVGLDPVIKAAASAGLDVMLIADAVEEMTQADYISFVSELVGYYSQPENGGCLYYEIMNEVQQGGSWIGGNGTVPTASEYCGLLRATYAAVKKANPHAQVLIGSLTCGVTGLGGVDGGRWLQQCYAAMGGRSDGYFDIMNVHGYTISGASGSGYGTALAEPGSLPNVDAWHWQEAFNPRASSTLANPGASPPVPSVRYQMVQAGDAGKPIWLTEFGAPSGSTGPSGADTYTNTCTYNGEAQMLLTALEQLESNNYNFVERFYAYEWLDSEDDFGMLDHLYRPKSIDGTFTGLPPGVSTVLEAFTSGCHYPSTFDGSLHTLQNQ